MREETVMANLPEGRFTWSPTEDYLIYSSSDEGEKVSGPLKRMLMPDDRIPGSRNRCQAALHHVETQHHEVSLQPDHPVRNRPEHDEGRYAGA